MWQLERRNDRLRGFDGWDLQWLDDGIRKHGCRELHGRSSHEYLIQHGLLGHS